MSECCLICNEELLRYKTVVADDHWYLYIENKYSIYHQNPNIRIPTPSVIFSNELYSCLLKNNNIYLYGVLGGRWKLPLNNFDMPKIETIEDIDYQINRLLKLFILL